MSHVATAPEFASLARQFQRAVLPDQLEELAVSLGVSTESLRSLGIGWSESLWCFPERDADGQIIGIATRDSAGRKKSLAGSTRGLTLAWPVPSYAGSTPDEPVLVVEGQTDTATAMDLGFIAIGRPSATSGMSFLRELLQSRHVVIVGENDPAGRLGAQNTAESLSKAATSVRIIYPPTGAKDLRAWRTAPAGCDRQELLAVIIAAEPFVADTGTSCEVEPALSPITATHHPFPVDSLPSLMARYVTALSAATGTDPAFAALAALVTAAGCIGNRAAIQVKQGWIEPAVLWGAIVGRSGTTKSPILKAVTRPLIEYHKREHAIYTEALTQHQAEVERFEIRLAEWRKHQRDGTASDPPLAPVPPTPRRQLVSDTTIEKLGALLEDNPLGLVLVRDEIAAWLGSFDRYAAGGKGSDQPAWLSMFDASTVVIDRKSGKGTIFVERAAVSILGSIQPGILRRLFGKAEREAGLLARILLVYPPDKPSLWSEDELDESTRQEWLNLLHDLLDLQPGQDDQGSPRPRIISLRGDAKAPWIEWHDRHARECIEIGDDDLGAHFSKLKGICARLALVFTCVEAVSTRQAVSSVDQASISRAITITEWFKGELRRIYGVMAENEGHRDQRKLIEMIQHRGGEITSRQLQQSSRAYPTTAKASAALDALVTAGLGQWQYQPSGDTGGRPTRVFHLSAPYPSTQPPSLVPLASTKPPPAGPDWGFVDVDSVDSPETHALTKQENG